LKPKTRGLKADTL